MIKWQNPLLTLGERCVAFAENELNNGVKEDHLNSYTSPRIREYFSICTRLVNGKEIKDSIYAGNWCAASISFCLDKSLLPGETHPHGYRLGVVEIVSDLQRIGLWRSIDIVRAGTYNIRVGDVIIFDRSQPGKPETAWFRHIGRVYSITDTGCQCISGNSGGCWNISSHQLSQSNLLGFGEYPDINSQTILTPSEGMDWSTVDVSQLAPMEDTGKDLDSFFDIYQELFK
jgi:hypothetical protein